MAQNRGGWGNFAQDRETASEAGRKGGEHSHGGGTITEDRDKSRESGGGQRGGSGNFAKDREKASEAGRKGGSR